MWQIALTFKFEMKSLCQCNALDLNALGLNISLKIYFFKFYKKPVYVMLAQHLNNSIKLIFNLCVSHLSSVVERILINCEEILKYNFFEITL